MRRSDHTADVVVVGGGVVGCSVAYELAKQGLSVALVERDSLAAHSTGQNAGGIRKQFSSEVTVRMQLLSLSLLESFEEEFGVSPGLRKIGYLFVLTNAADAAAFRDYLDLWKRVGLTDAYWVSPHDIRLLSPAVTGDDVLGGTFCPTDGLASPVDITYAYAAGARRLGAAIFERSEVISFEIDQGQVRSVVTTTSTISCDAAFICAGAWSRSLGMLACVDLPVDPYRRHIYLTGPVEGVTPETPMTVDFASSLYFHPEGEGVLFGMADDGPPTFDTRPDPAFLEAASVVAAKRAPALLDAEIRTGWAGLYEVTPDFQPILGPVEDVAGLWCACGFSGHGFMQAPAVALLLARQFVNGEVVLDLSSYAHSRFSSQRLQREQAVI